MGEDQSHDKRDEGTTVAEAARVLGITEGAVRKRVERGKLAAERTTDGRLIVHLERDTTATDTTATDTTRQSRGDRYTRGLEAEVEYLRRLLEDEREARTEERRRHDTLMAQLMQRIPELEAPSETRESDVRSSPTGTPTEASTEAQEGVQRPWWRRVFGGGALTSTSYGAGPPGQPLPRFSRLSTQNSGRHARPRTNWRA